MTIASLNWLVRQRGRTRARMPERVPYALHESPAVPSPLNITRAPPRINRCPQPTSSGPEPPSRPLRTTVAMLLTITATRTPATDLGCILHKRSGRARVFNPTSGFLSRGIVKLFNQCNNQKPSHAVLIFRAK
jgi:hypothetical protein